MKLKRLAYLSLAVLSLTVAGCSNAKNADSASASHASKPEVTNVIKKAERQASSKAKSFTNHAAKSTKPILSTAKSNKYTLANGSINPNIKPFSYQKGKRKMVIYRVDNLGRSLGSHIQLKESQTPTQKRTPYLTIRPSGWHNYKFTTDKNGKPYTTWLYNRGHLVGYQFCGLNQAQGNMITQTTYTNQGSLTGMNDSNKKGQLYYENMLRSWLIRHPSSSLDYSVTPLYKGDELVPRQIRFRFVGYSKAGKKMTINSKSNLAKTKNKVTTVTINNSSPQARINYATGRATVTNYK